MSRAVIVGASGLIGKSLHRVLRGRGIDVIGTRNSNAAGGELIPFDMRDQRLLDIVPSLNAEDTVYLLAAYSNPSWIHEHRAEAEALNLIGTQAVLEAARERGAHVVFMSSVEAFDGTKGEYVEDDATNPLNYYGVLKERIEHQLYARHDRYTVVRTGWNIGWDLSSRCVVKLTYETLRQPGARMARDNVFSIVDVDDTAAALAGLIGRDDIRKIHICADQKINRVWLAQRVIDKSAFGAAMAFREVDFAEIEYSEPRGRVNDLVNDQSKFALHATYQSAADVIDRKVALLDSHFAAA